MNNQPIIICASGASVPFLNSRYYNNHFSHGLEPQLESVIKGNYSIGLNWFWKYGCDTTFTSWLDWQLYLWMKEGTKNLGLMIGNEDPSLKEKTHPNTILLESNNAYRGIKSIEEGVFCKQLIGIWALSLAVSLGFTEIYLLGYDCCEVNGRTHFYQGVIDINKSIPLKVNNKQVENRKVFRGIGKFTEGKRAGKYKTGTYNNKMEELNQRYFEPFTKEDANIYNVSQESKITVFPKLTYEQFYSQCKNNHINQNEARPEIRKIIEERK